jgi:hypothetical protein
MWLLHRSDPSLTIVLGRAGNAHHLLWERVMSMESTAWQTAHRLEELAAEFSGWRFGLGGSGHWWAVRGNDLVRSRNVEELRSRLHEMAAAQRQ